VTHKSGSVRGLGAKAPGPTRPAAQGCRASGAGVRVLAHPETGKVKYASTHDLRRTFGDRWAALIMPAHLQQLMRHESIETTLRYYVGANAERTSEIC
jgi:integrase